LGRPQKPALNAVKGTPLLPENAFVVLVLALACIQLQGRIKFLACLRLFPDSEQAGCEVKSIRGLIGLLPNRFLDKRNSRVIELPPVINPALVSETVAALGRASLARRASSTALSMSPPFSQ
jgi:hypothetical protein